jgi:hypothetical protein
MLNHSKITPVKSGKSSPSRVPETNAPREIEFAVRLTFQAVPFAAALEVSFQKSTLFGELT